MSTARSDELELGLFFVEWFELFSNYLELRRFRRLCRDFLSRDL